MGPIHLNMGAAKEKTHERRIKGNYKPAAVLTWFSASGNQIPKLVKFEDDEGCIQTIRQLDVLKYEEKRYAGIKSVRYDCVCVIQGIQYQFILLYQPDFCNWKLITN